MAYSDDFTTMQEDALRRVREMQRRSREMVEEEPAPAPAPAEKKPPEKPGLSGLLGGIKIDEEKALIGLLIYILYKQGADIKLLLALGYLLL